MAAVLVIGGTRYFGNRLVHLLLEQKYEVTLLTRGRTKDDFSDRVQRIHCDRTDSNALAQAAKGHKWNLIFDQVCYDAHEAASACEIFADKTDRYIFTSSQSVYSEGRNISEEVFAPKFHKFEKIVSKDSDYAEAKRQAEATFSRLARFQLVQVRFPIVLGPDDYTKRLLFHIEHISEEKLISHPNLDSEISFISSEDAAKALLFIGQSSFIGPINFCSPDPISIRDLLEQIEKTVGKKAKITLNPAEGDPSPFGAPRDWYMSCARAKELGLDLAPLSEWLPQLIRNLTHF